MSIKTYTELSFIPDYLERFRYLSLHGQVANVTFGAERYINQRFYTSAEWKRARDYVIVRDNGCDLGIEGFEIYGAIHIHHIVPMTPEDIKHSAPGILDPDNLICVTQRTHNAIHYGDESQLITGPVERRPNDTIPWKK